MAVSRITVRNVNVRTFFQRTPLGGTALGAGRGFGQGDALVIASRMAVAARVNAATRFEQRTSSLVSSVRPVVRILPGGTAVGVATTVEHGYWLEVGTDYHFIRPSRAAFLQDNPNGPKGPVPEKWALRRRHRELPHPGSRENLHWMSDAVRSVLPGSFVRVRKLF